MAVSKEQQQNNESIKQTDLNPPENDKRKNVESPRK